MDLYEVSLLKLLLNIGLQGIDMRKGDMIIVKSEAGKGINCPIHGEAQAMSMQQQTKQEYLIAKSDAPTTAPKGV